MKRMGVSDSIVNIVENCLSQRAIIINRTTKLMALGSVLWNILYNGVLDIDPIEGVKSIAFADNLALIVSKSGRCHRPGI